MFSARSVTAAVAFCVILHTAVFAQVTTGDIVGRVTDSSGGVLPGATVTIEHLGTHDVRAVPSNSTGDFVFNLLPIGAYIVKVEMPGFITQSARVALSTGAIAEIKVQTSMYTAEVGRTAGGVVNIITKSGSNDYHGSAFEFVRNDRFDARNFFATGVDKPKLTQNQYGGSLGGPVARNKTFFFVDYEGFNVNQGVTAVATVPTAKMRAGDFSELSVSIFDPTSSPRTAFVGNQIPSARLDPIAMKVLALYPQPTGSGLANNYTGVRQ